MIDTTRNGRDPLVPYHIEDDDELDLGEVFDVLRRRKWIVIGCALLGLILGTLSLFYRVPEYDASVTLRIDEESQELPILEVLQGMAGTEVGTELEVLKSRVLAEDVVDSLGLQVVVTSPDRITRSTLLDGLIVEGWAPEAEYVLFRQTDTSFVVQDAATRQEYGTVGTSRRVGLPGLTFHLAPGAAEHDRIELAVIPFHAAVARTRENLAVSRPSREANLLQVSFASTDTTLLTQVPNLLARRFIARKQEVRKAGAASTVDFLETQIDSLGLRLATAEEALTVFREGEQVVSLQAEAEAQVTQLARLQAERNTLEAERSALEELVNEIEAEARTSDPTAISPYTRLISFPSLLRNQAASELLRTLNNAVNERADLLVRRTREDPDVIALSSRIAEIEQQLRSTATTYLQGLTNQVRSYDQTLARFGTELGRIPAKELQLARLEREQRLLEELYLVLENRLQEAEILEAVDDPTVRIVDPAIVPPKPSSPRPLIDLPLGLFLGLFAGVAFVVLREATDDRIHTPVDVKRVTRQAPVLGTIPKFEEGSAIGTRRGGSKATVKLSERVLAATNPRSPVAEAYRSLRTNLTYANIDDPIKTLVVTSPLPQDGKSTTAANLAVTLSQQGIRTLLVDADLRRGVLASVFDQPRVPGLTTVLQGSAKLDEAIRTVRVGQAPPLDFLSSGQFPPNPAEVLGSKRMRTLLANLRERYDVVVVDTAPLAVVTDAAVLAGDVDGVLLVVRADVTDKGAVRYADEQLEKVGVSLRGTLINAVDYKRDSRYYSSYGDYRVRYASYFADDSFIIENGVPDAEDVRPGTRSRSDAPLGD